MHLLSRRSAAYGCLLLATGGSGLALSACGTSRSGHASTHVKGAARHAASGSASSDGVCRTVKLPDPKGPQHLRRPTLRLNPSRSYVVRLVTNCGEIDIRLDVDQAPKITASFVYLVDLGFYNELTFHRVVSGFVIQGGDPNGDGSGGPGYTITEPPPENVQYTRGTVAMAKAAADPPGTAGSQFFIVTGENADLPPQYALLGKVVGGSKTVAAISEVPTKPSADGEDSAPSSPIVIRKASLHSG